MKLHSTLHGHVISFKQDPSEVLKKVPLVVDMTDLVSIVFIGPKIDIKEALRHRFRVRASVIQIWLHFLKQSHPSYANVEIDEDAIAS